MTEDKIDVIFCDRFLLKHIITGFSMTEPIRNAFRELSTAYSLDEEQITLVFMGQPVDPDSTLNDIEYFKDALIFVESNETFEVEGFATEPIEEEEATDTDSNGYGEHNDDDVTERDFSHSPIQEILDRGQETKKYPVMVTLSPLERNERSENIANNGQLIECFITQPDIIEGIIASLINPEYTEKLHDNKAILENFLARYKHLPQEIEPITPHGYISAEQFNILRRICRGDQQARDLLQETLESQRRNNHHDNDHDDPLSMFMGLLNNFRGRRNYSDDDNDDYDDPDDDADSADIDDDFDEIY
ncbi:hypothetical protein TVAG_340630 [Trichomonas vaginalis G3]|uniref:Ubiquitin-like domain-containing protein n=1 Tax=Trichomonas vaginalis (strain ATCC PRA-98 / G3) TaxID=412133 RepID=A2DTM2_TRIV3|nr:hypothetical protein TVAGG3_1037960 [Trichomonas vaginalis G3]EAY16169.1 hypothetical protein TVAG_340630 [Trichomonas vaginalis G3]KAI5493340.1 hypothetical protein TVAGG3_1037960 [Trichomonas vaginalis G3]|eukprot:XP_001328392.1 hypothetical protein [Trichomonas vaginalis G3]